MPSGSRSRQRRHAFVAVAVAVGLSPCISLVSAPSSSAGNVTPNVCVDYGHVTYYTTPSATYRADSDTRTYGRSGGTLTITLGESVTTGGSISGTTTAEAGVIFAKASVSVGVTIKKDWTNSVTRAYSWPVPSKQSTGWIEAGHRAYYVSYKQYRVDANCLDKLVKSGKILGNTSNIRFNHS